MANQEGAGRRISGISAPPRERTAPPVPPKPEVGSAPEALRQPKKGKGFGTKTRLALAGLAAVGAGATGAYEGYQNIPAVHRAVDSAFLDHLRGKSSLSEASTEVFDPTANRQTVKAGINTIAVSETELKKAYEEQSAQNKDGRPTVIFPVIFTADGQRVDYEYAKPLTNSTDSQTGQPVTQEFPGRITLQLDKDQKLPVVAEDAEVFQFKHVVIDGNDHFIGFFIKFQQNGALYGLRIAPADVRTFIPIGEAANAPTVPTNAGGTLLLSEAKDGLKLSLATVLANLNFSNTTVYLNFDRYNPQTGRWESARPNFVTDNSTGTTKLPMVPTTQ